MTLTLPSIRRVPSSASLEEPWSSPAQYFTLPLAKFWTRSPDIVLRAAESAERPPKPLPLPAPEDWPFSDATNILDEQALSDVAVAVGSWDILILNAGFVSSPASIVETPVDEWWQSFETNVKGTLNTLKAFLPTASPSRAVVLGVTSGAICMPPAMLGGVSAYIGSKTAQVKLLEFAAAEHPNIFVAAVHPGMVDTAMFRKSGAQPESVPMDNGQFIARS
ncbi:MAG: hypothetical protein Q9172_005531 [Xanthocarpia lactea]